MTTTDAARRTHGRRAALSPDPATVAGAAGALGCTVVGQYAHTPWRASGSGWSVDFADGGGLGALAVLVAFVVVAAAVVSVVVAAARAAGAAAAGRRAVWLAVVGAVSLAVFWTGLPAVLAGGAAGLAVSSRRRGGTPAPAVIAGTLAVLTLAGAVSLALVG